MITWFVVESSSSPEIISRILSIATGLNVNISDSMGDPLGLFNKLKLVVGSWSINTLDQGCGHGAKNCSVEGDEMWA